MLKNKNCGQTFILFMYKFAWTIYYIIADNNYFRKTVLLEWIYEQNQITHTIIYTPFDDECSVRIYWSFATIFHKCMNIVINAFYTFPIALNAFSGQLCSKFCWNNRWIFIPHHPPHPSTLSLHPTQSLIRATYDTTVVVKKLLKIQQC